MQPAHLLLAVLMAAIWGVNFVFIRMGLDELPPLLMVALRFVVSALPALFLPRPMAWPALIALSLTLFVGQYALLFSGMEAGMPPGLASMMLQVQAFFTILIAVVALGERPGRRQIAGGAVALAGLILVAATAESGGMTLTGLGLVLAGALSWAGGNVLLRRASPPDMLAAIAWLSVVPPLPMLALSLALEGPDAIGGALAGITWRGVVALLYVGGLSTIAGFAIWGGLLRRYPTAVVAPFSLLVPVFGTLASALVLGERFGPLRLAGMALIMLGLAVVALPLGRFRRLRPGGP